jgi:putative SOS response-associated peptidase YedK
MMASPYINLNIEIMRRFSANNDKNQWKKYLGNLSSSNEWILHKNIDVGDSANLIINADKKIVVGKWGFMVAEEQDSLSIPFVDANRAHTLPSFRMAFRYQRGILLADSFYGWEEKKKIPHRIVRTDKYPLFIAVLYRELKETYTFAILYKKARKALSFLKKEPIVMEPDNWKPWLESIPVKEILKKLDTQTTCPYEFYPISNKVLIKGNNADEIHQKNMSFPSLFS